MRHLRDFSASLMFIQETGFCRIVLKYFSNYLNPNFHDRKGSTNSSEVQKYRYNDNSVCKVQKHYKGNHLQSQ